MKVPIKKKNGKIKSGVVEDGNGIVYTLNKPAEEGRQVFVTIDNYNNERGAHYRASSARQAEKFFHNLANVLEGKPQVD